MSLRADVFMCNVVNLMFKYHHEPGCNGCDRGEEDVYHQRDVRGLESYVGQPYICNIICKLQPLACNSCFCYMFLICIVLNRCALLRWMAGPGSMAEKECVGAAVLVQIMGRIMLNPLPLLPLVDTTIGAHVLPVAMVLLVATGGLGVQPAMFAIFISISHIPLIKLVRRLGIGGAQIKLTLCILK